jgi:hypothetical protein
VGSVPRVIKVQSGVAEHQAGPPADRRSEFRAGVHGEVVEEEDGSLIGADWVPEQ